MDHANLSELAAGAALDDLDPAERAELDAHLASCPNCRGLVLELDDVLADLALAAPELQPPASLRREVLRRLQAPEVTAIPVQAAAAPAGSRQRSRLTTWAPLALAAGLAVVAVGLGVRTQQLGDEIGSMRAALADVRGRSAEAGAAMALVAAPDHVTTALHAEPLAPVADAVVLYRPGSTDAYLLATGLPPTPDGHVYQLWVADAAGVHALGTFQHDGSGAFVAPFGVDLGTSAAAMVTLEPDGGATGEPGPQVVFGEL